MDSEWNQCQKIYTNDVTAFALNYTDGKPSQPSDEEIAIFKKASTILRRRILKFVKDNALRSIDFRVAFGENQKQLPPELTSFMEGVLFGQQKLVSERKRGTDRVSSIFYSVQHENW